MGILPSQRNVYNLFFLMYAILHNDNKTTHTKESTHYIQDSAHSVSPETSTCWPVSPGWKETTRPMGAFLPACRLTPVPPRLTTNVACQEPWTQSSCNSSVRPKAGSLFSFHKVRRAREMREVDHATRIPEPEIESGLLPEADC